MPLWLLHIAEFITWGLCFILALPSPHLIMPDKSFSSSLDFWWIPYLALILDSFWGGFLPFDEFSFAQYYSGVWPGHGSDFILLIMQIHLSKKKKKVLSLSLYFLGIITCQLIIPFSSLDSWDPDLPCLRREIRPYGACNYKVGGTCHGFLTWV